MKFRKLQQLDLTGKKVFLRLDLDLPIDNGTITDQAKLMAALPTLRHILSQTNKVVIAGHLGSHGSQKPRQSFDVVGVMLAEKLECEVVFIEDYTREPVEQVLNQLDPNQIILLENLSFHPEEESNDTEFARDLVRGFDFYVNDAFAATSRKRASVVAVAQSFKSEQRAGGLAMQEEVERIDRLKNNSSSPFVALIGGESLETKAGVILTLLNHCNHLLLGGKLAYPFLKFNGHSVGEEKVEGAALDLVGSIYRNAQSRRVKIDLPVDHLCASNLADLSQVIAQDSKDIGAGYYGVDIGPRTIDYYSEVLSNAQQLFWNGPMGIYEELSAAKGTNALANAIFHNPADAFIVGEDTVLATRKTMLGGNRNLVSYGDHAALDLIEDRILPGLAVLFE